MTPEEKQEIKRVINYGYDVRRKAKRLLKINRAYNAQEVEVLKRHILDEVASSPYGLHALCDQFLEWPCESTIQRWEREDPEFEAAMKLALKQQARVLSDYALEIACDGTQDVEGGDVKSQNMSVRVSRDSLAVKTLMQRAAIHNREVYGNSPINPLEQQKIETQEEYVARMNRLKQEILERERLSAISKPEE